MPEMSRALIVQLSAGKKKFSHKKNDRIITLI